MNSKKKNCNFDRDYYAVRFERTLRIINIIQQIRESEEFKDFCKWLKDFYLLQVRDLVSDLTYEFSIRKDQLVAEVELSKAIINYIFDCLQYGRNTINRSNEGSLASLLGHDRFINQVKDLRLEFKNQLISDAALKEAYVKLTEHIDIRYLVFHEFNPEHIFLTWITIENYFMAEALGSPRVKQENFDNQKIKKQISHFLLDFELLAKNKGYEIGHTSIKDSALFEKNSGSVDYTTFRLSENFRVSVLDGLVDYLEFAKVKMNETSITKGITIDENARFEELNEIIKILNTHNSKTTKLKSVGLFRLLCYTIYRLKLQEFLLEPKVRNADLNKRFFDYLSNLLGMMEISHGYLAKCKDRRDLELVIYFTESKIEDDILETYCKFSRITNSTIFLEKIGRVSEEDQKFINLYEEVSSNVKFKKEKILFEIKASNLNTLKYEMKDKPFSFDDLYKFKNETLLF